MLVTIATFMYSPQAAVPAALLEAHDIHCYIKDELVTNTFYSNAAGGVKLQVWEKDVAQATDLLVEGGFLTESDLRPSAFMRLITRFLTWSGLIPKTDKV